MKKEFTKKDYNILRDSMLKVTIIVIYFFITLNRTFFKSYSPDAIDFILNTLPNFSAGIIGTIAFYEYLKHYRNGLLFSIMISGIWLTIEEFHPIFSHNLYFDIWDIIMSWFGCGIATFFITQKQKKQIINENYD